MGDQRTDVRRGAWIDPRAGDITFGEWANTYLDHSQKRPTTAARDENVLHTHFLPQLRAISLSVITPRHVQQIVKTMEKRLAPATVRTNYGVLKAVLNAAVESEVIVRSPCRGIRLAPDTRHERQPLTSQQLASLAEALPAEYQPVVYLGGVLGLRWSEVVGLRVRNLDFFGRTLSVESTLAEVGGHLVPADTKSRAGRRTLAVPGFIMTMLSEHLARRDLDASDGDAYVFVGPAGGPLRASNFRTRIWIPATKRVELSGLTFHGLRHSATSLMVEAGLHPRLIQHRLGHATSRLSMELYAHISDDADRQAAARLEESFTDHWVTRGSRQGRRGKSQ